MKRAKEAFTRVRGIPNGEPSVETLKREHNLLEILSAIQSEFIAHADRRDTFDNMLTKVLDLTESEYGFIGEVLYAENEKPYLKTYALTNIAWDDATRKFYDDNAPKGLEFANLDTLFGRVMATGETVIANDPANDPRSGGLPPGHPSLDAFLGLPFYSGRELVGMLGIANRPGGYDEDMIEFLEPLSHTCGVLVQALRVDARRRDADEALRAEQARASAAETRLLEAIEAMPDGFALFDTEDRIVLFNTRFREFYSTHAEAVKEGATLEQMLLAGIANGAFPEAVGREEEWIAERLNRHTLGEVVEQRLSTGRWLRIIEQRTKDGGIVGVRTDITELKRREAELQEAREIADRANLAKSEFLSRMSHELRTPLNAVLGFAQLLECDRERPLSEKQVDYARDIQRGGEHLLELIDEVLDLAKIEAGMGAVTIERVSPRKVIQECLMLTRSIASKRGIEIVVRTTDDAAAPAVMADPTRLRQIVLNLLSNAIKYNHENGTVTIECGPAPDGRLRISVADTGPGIPEERQAELFQPFNRLGAETTEIEGTGIGLTITRKLVELMSGEIGFQSAAGAGATFWIDLPAAGDDAGEEPQHEPCREPRPTPTSDGTGDERTMLYVEDNPANLKLMEEIVRRVPNLSMRSAHTAELGLELAEICNPDVIVMDINLPGMDGFQALERLRQAATTSTIPVIALSADAMPATIERSLQAGFCSYLTKPIRIDQLIAGIEGAMDKVA